MVLQMSNLTIVNMKFGSNLYGTNTANSDRDFKGVFLPDEDQLLLGKIPRNINSSTGSGNSKNTSEDVDTEMFSLHEFIKLSCEGQMIAMDMLHAPSEMLLESGPIWQKIVDNREKFYTKKLQAFVGYCRTQAAKYGVKGSRLHAAKEVIDILEAVTENVKLEVIWEELPTNEHCHFAESSPNGIRQYEVCGKKFQATERRSHALQTLYIFYNNYGSRAKMAAENKGIDFKAVSHAVRAAMQVKELLTTGTMTFPLREADLIVKIKLGEMDYLTQVAPLLEELMEEVQELSDNSLLPKKPDRKFWDEFIKETMRNYVIQ